MGNSEKVGSASRPHHFICKLRVTKPTCEFELKIILRRVTERAKHAG